MGKGGKKGFKGWAVGKGFNAPVLVTPPKYPIESGPKVDKAGDLSKEDTDLIFIHRPLLAYYRTSPYYLRKVGHCGPDSGKEEKRLRDEVMPKLVNAAGLGWTFFPEELALDSDARRALKAQRREKEAKEKEDAKAKLRAMEGEERKGGKGKAEGDEEGLAEPADESSEEMDNADYVADHLDHEDAGDDFGDDFGDGDGDGYEL